MITEQHPDERVAWSSVDEPKQAGVVTFHRLADRTRPRSWSRWTSSPRASSRRPATSSVLVKHRVKGDLERFKDFIETRGTESGAWRGEVR